MRKAWQEISLKAQTDIPGNFGAIVSISRDSVKLFDMGPGRIYEERTKSQIAPSTFKAIAVPLGKVQQYTDIVNQLGLGFPVVSIEAVEYHMSQFSLHELTKGLKVATINR